MKQCSSCGRKMALKHFHRHSNGGHQSQCKECRRITAARKYGLSRDDFLTILESQGGCCGICGCDGPLVVDHCHDTGEVRGLLCSQCNSGIGLLNDSYTLLLAALEWVDPFKANDAEEALQRTRNGAA